MYVEWQDFTPGSWTTEIDVKDFIHHNYTPYQGNGDFLAPPTAQTQQLWHKVADLMALEREKGVLDVDTTTPSSITAHEAGYIDAELEQIVGLQTDKPLKRAIMPYGGIRVVKAGLESYGYHLDPQTEAIFTKYRKTHNDGVFDVYTTRNAKSQKIRHYHGVARCLWTGADYWGLSTGRALWGRSPD